MAEILDGSGETEARKITRSRRTSDRLITKGTRRQMVSKDPPDCPCITVLCRVRVGPFSAHNKTGLNCLWRLCWTKWRGRTRVGSISRSDRHRKLFKRFVIFVILLLKWHVWCVRVRRRRLEVHKGCVVGRESARRRRGQGRLVDEERFLRRENGFSENGLLHVVL